MAGNVTDEQVVAANVNVTFIVMGLDQDYSVRRLERYLLLSGESGAAPVVLLTKPDVGDDVERRIAEVRASAQDVPVHVLNPRAGRRDRARDALSDTRPYWRAARIVGRRQDDAHQQVDRNRGAPNARRPPRGFERTAYDNQPRAGCSTRTAGLLIDTPGMRELQLWDVGNSVRDTFDDIDALAPSCHFTDCAHRDEPRCAVKAAVQGRLAGGGSAGKLPGGCRTSSPISRSSRTNAPS
jgi:ribosome biogenesis GTPase